MKRWVPVGVLGALLLAIPAWALASARQPRRHHRHHCSSGRVRRHGRCVRKHHGRHHKKPKPKPVITYRAKVDPTFTQATGNPLAVTYQYSAAAISSEDGVTKNLGAEGQLPAGVLNFYSEQQPGGSEALYCSVNVGGSALGGSCPIAYPNTGTYQVTTEYIPNGVTAVSETDQETISPYATTTDLTATEGTCGSGSPPGYDFASGPYCEYTLANTVTDQKGNTEGPQIVLSVAPNTGQTPEARRLPANASCTIYVTSSWVLSSDCDFELGSGLYDATSWELSASYPGQPGWTASSSSVASVSP